MGRLQQFAISQSRHSLSFYQEWMELIVYEAFPGAILK
jgi:hypothetical protein